MPPAFAVCVIHANMEESEAASVRAISLNYVGLILAGGRAISLNDVGLILAGPHPWKHVVSIC